MNNYTRANILTALTAAVMMISAHAAQAISHGPVAQLSGIPDRVQTPGN